ncbi:MAG: lysophospholipid acyltransferase family protein [Rhodocyclaceae bacterium]|jgi:1-acyl-sn-glycerol-3-phosphate acyltransferase|nr:lysophospholipid acyltransferase family protein [Rhodocyclaceae bacterium]MCA3084303.1 lysophospholipid acyltransferase family protein [Rhodocyclaceae bacterium]
MMRITGWKFEGQLPDVRKVLVSVAPHTSNWDFVVGVMALFALDLRISFLGKHTLFRGIVGRWMRSIGGVPVDRSRPTGVVRDVADAITAADRIVFAMAPEGTRRLDKGFKTGFIHIAHTAQVPICLAYFDFSRKVIGFGPVFQPSGDAPADIAKITDYYRPIRGRYQKDWQRDWQRQG